MMNTAILILFCLAYTEEVLGEEAECLHLSKFDYEFQIVKKMAQMEVYKQDMDSAIQKSETELSDFTTKIDSLESMMSSVTTKLEAVDSLQEKVITLEDNLSQMKNDFEAEMVKLRKVDNGTVAFTAGLSSNPNYVTGATIVFDTITTNIGGGYIPYSGIFTAPKTGLYLFSLTITSEYMCDAAASIMKDDDDVGTVYADGYYHGNSGTGNYAAASVSVLVELIKGDNVYVKMTTKSCSSGSYNILAQKSFFAGLLIDTN